MKKSLQKSNRWLVVSALALIVVGGTVSRSHAVPSSMPIGMRVYVGNIGLCEERKLAGYDPRDEYGDSIPCTVPHWDPGPPSTGRDYYYFDSEYLTGVLKQEVGPVAGIDPWEDEALKAMAVAARSYGWYRAYDYDAAHGIYSINDTSQAFFPEKTFSGVEHYPAAVAATAGQYLSHPDGGGSADVISAEYSLNCGDPTVTYPSTPGDQRRYLVSVPDPVVAGTTREGNGWGLSQKGAHYWASGQNAAGNRFPQWDYLQILAHYYTGIHFAGVSPAVPDNYRFNILEEELLFQRSYEFGYVSFCGIIEPLQDNPIN